MWSRLAGNLRSSSLGYEYRSLAAYAAAARVPSKGISAFLDGLPPGKVAASTKQLRHAIDLPYRPDLLRLGLL